MRPEPKYGNREEFIAYEKLKMASITPSERSAKIEAAKRMLDAGQIQKQHFDTIASNLK